MTGLGLAVVAASAAVLSFATLRDLAIACGFPPHLAWLVPVVIDATAVVGSRIWLGGIGPIRAVRYARTLALAAAAVTVGANVLQHGLAAYHSRPAWGVIALLAAVPPIALVSVAHQIALLSGCFESSGSGAGESALAPADGAFDPDGTCDLEPERTVPADPVAELSVPGQDDHAVASTAVAGVVTAEGLGVQQDLAAPEVALQRARALQAGSATRLGRRMLAQRLGVSEHEARRLRTQLDLEHDQMAPDGPDEPGAPTGRVSTREHGTEPPAGGDHSAPGPVDVRVLSLNGVARHG